MKKFFLLILVGLLFFSCSEDEEERATIAVYNNHMDFGEVIIGETSSPQNIEIKNLSSEKALVIDDLMLDDTDNFALSYTGTLPIRLESGESMEVSVTFIPQDMGTFTATLKIDSNANNLSPKATAVNLEGEGIQEPLQVLITPSYVDFGIVGENFVSEPKSIFIQNVGNQAVEITQLPIEPSENFSLAEEFIFFNLPLDSQQEVELLFNPDSAGIFDGTVSVKSYGNILASVDVHGQAISRLDRLFQWMTGSFSSEAQADTSSDPYHYAISLKMVRIWDDLDDYWVYVEQAEIGEAPYRQRIYKVFEEAGQLQDEIYRMDNPEQYYGNWTWDDTSIFDDLTPEDLELAEGCNVFFTVEDGDHFYGSTEGTGCESSIPGVEYLTSETTIYENYLTSWDLGYDAFGNIVMGPYSPYLFDKLEDWPPYGE